MRIKTLSVKSNVQVAPYVHLHIEAGADVELGENPVTVLDGLKEFVSGQLRRAVEGDPLPPTTGRFVAPTLAGIIVVEPKAGVQFTPGARRQD